MTLSLLKGVVVEEIVFSTEMHSLFEPRAAAYYFSVLDG